MAGGILAAILTYVISVSLVSNSVPLLWVCAIVPGQVTCAAIGFSGGRKTANAGPIPPWTLRAIEAFYLAFGLMWAYCFIVVSNVASEVLFSIYSTYYVGVVGCGSLAMGVKRRPALLLLLPMIAGLSVGWFIHSGPAYGAGILIGAVTLMGLVVSFFTGNEKRFVAQLAARLNLAESNQTIQIFLNDLERQSTDWLWQIDSDGAIVNPSERFCAKLREIGADGDRRRLVPLFEHCAARDVLEQNLAARRPFRDLQLQLATATGQHWWKLSALPSNDGSVRGLAVDVSSEIRAESRINFLAHFDTLTGLANRYQFTERLEGMLAASKSSASPAALLFFDLDRFKAINDTHGHLAGDALLREVANRISPLLPEDGVLARLGGDEFAALIPRSPAPDALHAMLDTIRKALTVPLKYGDSNLLTAASIGVAFAVDVDDANELMRRADVALYAAKAGGRNCFATYSPELDRDALALSHTVGALREAVRRNELELHFQPQAMTDSGAITGYEALLRWNRPGHGQVLPATFISAAEEAGLIGPIGEWVIREAARVASTWPGHLRVAINISPSQLKDGRLVPVLVNAAAANGFDPGRFELEITENVLLEQTAANVATLRQLHDLGFRLALDDFGTGFSSLSYLRSLPFSKIKIDRCFVAELAHSAESRSIVRAIIGLAKNLAMETIAEGVETIEQHEILATEACDQVQGFLIARPLSLADLARVGDPERRRA